MKLNNREELEQYFADKFDTILFPVLAEQYFVDGDLERAERVCDIGFRFHGDSLLGLFIKARVMIARRNFEQAEKCLKKIIDSDPGFLNAYLLMVDVELGLNHSTENLKQVYSDIIALDPGNPQAKKGLEPLVKKHTQKNTRKKKATLITKKAKPKTISKTRRKVKPDKKNKTQEKSQSKPRKTLAKKKQLSTRTKKDNKRLISTDSAELKELEVSPKLATFTLVRVLRSQKLYDQALEVLSIMAKKRGIDKRKVSQEKDSIVAIIEAGGGA